MNEATATVVPAPQEIKLSERNLRNFWKKVNKDGPTMPHMESQCWAWNACKGRGGYGGFRVGARMLPAHRVAWVLIHGQIPHDGSYYGLNICHRCDNPECCRVDHLFLGTTEDNIRDMISKGRQAKGDKNGARTRPETRARGAAIGTSKLDDSKVISIRVRYAAGGVTMAALAVEFGVSIGLICHIITRRIWKHIPPITTGPQSDT